MADGHLHVPPWRPLRLSVDDEEDDTTQEVVYNLNEEGAGHGEDGEDKKREEAATDEPRAMEKCRAVLSLDLGYCASITRNGDNAIKKFQEAKDLQRPFDAVILDLLVPGGMDGHEVLERLRSMDPGVKAVLLTGEIDHQALVHYAERGFKAVLLKPFMRAELIQALEWAVT